MPSSPLREPVPMSVETDMDGNYWFTTARCDRVLVPPGWAVRIEDGKVEFVLALVADSAELAEQMAAEEADRFVAAFADDVAAWLCGDWSTESEARAEYKKIVDKLPKVQQANRFGMSDSERPMHFEEWCAEQIRRAARKERTLP